VPRAGGSGSSGNEQTFVDGPFTETKELRIDRYSTAIPREGDRRDRSFANAALHGGEAEIVVRQLFELDDYVRLEGIERFRKLGKRDSCGRSRP